MSETLVERLLSGKPTPLEREAGEAIAQAQARCAVLTGLLREVYGEFAKRHIRSTDLQSRIDAALGNSRSGEVDG